MHVKCMRIWASHRKTDVPVECPFCRSEFGPFEESVVVMVVVPEVGVMVVRVLVEFFVVACVYAFVIFIYIVCFSK